MVFTEDMLDFLYILSLILAVCALVPALAHALELPGKLRLAKDAYFAVQPIYYPGFTIVGVAGPSRPSARRPCSASCRPVV
jgi:hypothetical protein